MMLPVCGKTPQAVILDEARCRRGRPPRESWSSHLVNLQAVVSSLACDRKAERALRTCDAFKTLSVIQMAMIASGGVMTTTKRYAKLFRQNAHASSFFVLLQGAVQLVSEPMDMVTKAGADAAGITTETLVVRRGDRAGHVIGTEALSADVRRTATCECLEPCKLLVVNTHRKGLALDAKGAAKLATSVFVDAARAALQRTPLFRDLPEKRMADIARLFRLETIEAERAIFLEGDVPKHLFILLAGSVDLVKHQTLITSLDGSRTLVGDGHPFFGATAFLMGDGATRPWDAYSRTPCRLLVLSVRSFKAFLRAVPDFHERLQGFVEMRKRKWELDSGRSLPVGAMQYQQALEEAATTIQLETRGWQARRTYSEIRIKELARRGVSSLHLSVQAKSSRSFVSKLDGLAAKARSAAPGVATMPLVDI